MSQTLMAWLLIIIICLIIGFRFRDHEHRIDLLEEKIIKLQEK